MTALPPLHLIPILAPTVGKMWGQPEERKGMGRAAKKAKRKARQKTQRMNRRRGK